MESIEKNDHDNEDDKKYLDALYARRQFLDETRINLGNNFDKYLLTFSTGSLYLSILFTNNLDRVLLHKYLLGFGWIFLLLSIISSLISIFLSSYAYKRQISITDMRIRCLYDGNVDSHNGWNDFINIIQALIITFFIFGILLLSVFYFLNLK